MFRPTSNLHAPNRYSNVSKLARRARFRILTRPNASKSDQYVIRMFSDANIIFHRLSIQNEFSRVFPPPGRRGTATGTGSTQRSLGARGGEKDRYTIAASRSDEWGGWAPEGRKVFLLGGLLKVVGVIHARDVRWDARFV